MSKKQQQAQIRKIVIRTIVLISVVVGFLTFPIARLTQIDRVQILTVNGHPFSLNNFLVDAETLSRELQQMGIDIHIDTVDGDLILIPRSVDLRHTSELMMWGNWLNANYGTATHDLGTGGTIQQNDTISFQFAHTNAMGAYTFTRRVVDDRGPDNAELYRGTYWIDSNNVLHLHYRFSVNGDGEILELLDLHQQWLFEWVYSNVINLWQVENPTEVIQLQRVSLP